MAYNFKSLADVELLKTTSDSVNLIAEEDGKIVKVAVEDVASGDAVKSINSKAPDENGNIIINELPENTQAHQQLVTDSDGKTRWEDVPFGDYVELLEIVPPTTVNVGEAEGWDAGFRLGELSGCDFLFHDNGNGGKKYRVIWDGASYDCVSYGDFAGSRSGIGNSKLFPEIASAGGKGEPFLFYFYYITSIRAEYPGTHTFAIYEMIDSVRTIDPKYLPELVVNFTMSEDGISADKTFAEVAAAVVAGRPVRGVCHNTISLLGVPHMLCRLCGWDSDSNNACTGIIFDGTSWVVGSRHVNVLNIVMIPTGDMIVNLERFALTVAE